MEAPATLDHLNGHTVSCTIREYDCEGITIIGNGTTIQNGIVSGSTYGISGYDINGALIKDIIAFDNYKGIYIRGNNNRLINFTVIATATATDYLTYGIRIQGDNNQVKDCYLSRSGILMEGRNNAVISNIVEDMDDTCIRLFDGSGSVIINNTVRRCGWNGLDVSGEFYSAVAASVVASAFSASDAHFNYTRVAGNRIYKSGGGGIMINYARNVVVESNVIVDSAEDGIVLHPSARRWTIKNNTIRKCGMSGLGIRGADATNFTDNKISFCRRVVNPRWAGIQTQSHHQEPRIR